MSLHPPVLFLADRPSPTDLSLEAPFVGTKAYKTLLEWIYRLDLDINLVTTRFAHSVRGEDIPWYDEEAFIIALGESAKLAAMSLSENRITPISIFMLPSPTESVEPKKLSDLLVRCRTFIHGR